MTDLALLVYRLEDRMPVKTIMQRYGLTSSQVMAAMDEINAARRNGTIQEQTQTADSQAWSPQEAQRLKFLYTKGWTYEQIAWDLSRTKAGICHMIMRMREEGQLDSRVNRWSQEEMDACWAMYCQGQKAPKIGAALGRTPTAVRSLLQKLREDKKCSKTKK